MTVMEAIELPALAAGQPVVVGTPNGAFMMMDAAATTAAWINLMATEARGITGLAISHRRAVELGLTLQPRRGGHDAPRYTSSIEAVAGVSSGISAHDRAATILAAVGGMAADITTPGHVFPHLPTGDAGGIADIALRLAAQAGCRKGAVTCAILNDDGDCADRSFAATLARRLGLAFVDTAEGM